jgi:RNA polymerase sigma-70 factor, ECF subfamily
MADDLALLRAARDRDPGALAAIFDRYAPALYKYALRLCRDPNEADDVVGDVFSELINQLQQGKGPRDNLRSYLYQIAYHCVVDRSRHGSRSSALDDSLPADPDGIPSFQREEQEVLGALEIALQRDLNEEQRQVVLLRFIENFSLQETSAITGKSVGNVKAIQSRAVAILRRIVTGQFQDSS